MWLLIACICYALTCVMIFDQNLVGTIFFGCASLCSTWMAGAALRGGNTYNNDNSTTTNTYNNVTHNSIYMPDGTLSPFATPEAIKKLHKQLGVPDKLNPVTIYVDREYRIVENPILIEGKQPIPELPRPQQEEFRGDLVPVQEQQLKALPPPKKRSMAVALIMGPKKSK